MSAEELKTTLTHCSEEQFVSLIEAWSKRRQLDVFISCYLNVPSVPLTAPIRNALCNAFETLGPGVVLALGQQLLQQLETGATEALKYCLLLRCLTESVDLLQIGSFAQLLKSDRFTEALTKQTGTCSALLTDCLVALVLNYSQYGGDTKWAKKTVKMIRKDGVHTLGHALALAKCRTVLPKRVPLDPFASVLDALPKHTCLDSTCQQGFCTWQDFWDRFCCSADVLLVWCDNETASLFIDVMIDRALASEELFAATLCSPFILEVNSVPKLLVHGIIKQIAASVASGFENGEDKAIWLQKTTESHDRKRSSVWQKVMSKFMKHHHLLLNKPPVSISSEHQARVSTALNMIKSWPVSQLPEELSSALLAMSLMLAVFELMTDSSRWGHAALTAQLLNVKVLRTQFLPKLLPDVEWLWPKMIEHCYKHKQTHKSDIFELIRLILSVSSGTQAKSLLEHCLPIEDQQLTLQLIETIFSNSFDENAVEAIQAADKAFLELLGNISWKKQAKEGTPDFHKSLFGPWRHVTRVTTKHKCTLECLSYVPKMVTLSIKLLSRDPDHSLAAQFCVDVLSRPHSFGLSDEDKPDGLAILTLLLKSTKHSVLSQSLMVHLSADQLVKYHQSLDQEEPVLSLNFWTQLLSTTKAGAVLSEVGQSFLPQLLAKCSKAADPESLLKFSRSLLNCGQLEPPPVGLCLVILSVTNLNKLQHQEFVRVFQLWHLILNDALTLHLSQTAGMIGCYVPLVQRMMEQLLSRCSATQTDQAVQEYLGCCHLFSRLCLLIGNHKLHFSKVSPYLLSSYIRSSQAKALHYKAKVALRPGVNALLDLCDNHSIALLSTNLDSALKEAFGSLYKDYNKFHKYKGSV